MSASARDLDPAVRGALRALEPGPAPADLADRAFRRAMTVGERAATLAERFVVEGRWLAYAGVVAACAAWVGVWLRAGDPAARETAGRGAAPAGAVEPGELAVLAWTGEEVEP